MGKPVIEVQDLSKLYRLGDIGASTVRESLERLWLRWRGSTNGVSAPPAAQRLNAAQTGPQPDSFWALKDVSFTVRPGEIIGIIGHNGAGKSTLLKILSRITEPTTGRAVLRGRVGSLLEVGTGFHPELSGRDNIYLNGAMLGMKKHEIERKFDEIVAFSEIENFVDTPVKRYSSGMYVRLAFAVAAHLEPEILLVDEVLAVGDAAFQKKCLGKMDDVAKHGRTVVLVSHNMASIQALCQRVLWVDGGRIAADGLPGPIVRGYLASTQKNAAIALDQREGREGDGSARIISLTVEDAGGGAIYSTSCLKITVRYRSNQLLRHPRFVISIYDQADAGIFRLDTEMAGGFPEELPANSEVVCTTAPINLTPGRCILSVSVRRGTVIADTVHDAAFFDVESDDFHGYGKLPGREKVLCLLQHSWSIPS